eukprot:SM000374S13844  [mRNA]  locus=s374:38452:40206:- [translate_table: standard]
MGLQEYYRRQQQVLEGFREVDALVAGRLPSDQERKEAFERERGEQRAVLLSNYVNIVLFAAKLGACLKSKSLAVIASTLDSFLDLVSGLILWFTAHFMKVENPADFPIGKRRMQPVGIIVFAAIMATLGMQVLLEGLRQLCNPAQGAAQAKLDLRELLWLCIIMGSAVIIKLGLYLFCRQYDNDIVQAYALDHFFDVMTNGVGLAAALLAQKFYWWIDPVGAIVLAVYTIYNWSTTVVENGASLVGKCAPPDFIAKVTYLVYNHHADIRRIDTVRAYTIGNLYFCEVDIELPKDMSLHEAHDIGESLQNKLESLEEVERAFVHLDYECTHKLEHTQSYVPPSTIPETP